MQLILTHEQADFDALASLYGAYLLDEQSLPVLPRRMNRNVRAFLTLYGTEFPFIDPRDLPAEPVELVTLVDTQSLVTLKGMDKQTRVQVIDHHPLRPDLSDEWQINLTGTGAVTTALTENLRERNGHVSGLQATLLLLGIYEDTGSMSYVSTTPRDVRAAAYLLERGASLKIAADFLNPPLSQEQQKVYDQLVDKAKTHMIQGHRVVVACGQAKGLVEEISTLAHKLRDLLDPDALFVLLETVEGVRLVARSTTDEIDVAAVSSEFGGGGHGRAAAALIRNDEQDNDGFGVAQVCQRLLDILPEHVRPSVTVSQIMSRGPQVLKPETPVEEAALLMQRYGYEGYPVVGDGKVVGLLTRRAVDRAIAHKLNLTAASLMDAGEVTVLPSDSLQLLQARMIDSGWGQIPVIDPDGGEVVGIVTRTDILKTLAPQELRPTSRNLARKLEAALPPKRLALIRAVAEQSAAQNVAVYIVGGFVRDLLLERPSMDFDIVVEGDAIALGRALSENFGGRITHHSRFGTAKWFLQESKFENRENGPEFLDLISARTEFYEHPTALPTVERGSIKLDLHRRDFTINTLALRLDGHHYGELHDYWGGLNDLEQGLVRVLHSLSFVDDPTRMLRAVRFEQRFDFMIEARTRELIDEAHELLERLTGERVRHELDLILAEPRAVEMLARLSELNLLHSIHPSLPWDTAIQTRLTSGLDTPPPDELGSVPNLSGLPFRRAFGYLLWLLSVPPHEIASIAKRLRFPVSLTKALQSASRLWADLPSLDCTRPSCWVARLEDLHPLALYAIYQSTEGPTCTAMLDYLVKWQHVHPTIDGNTLKEMGVPPGPVYQRVLGRLRDAWLDGEIETQTQEKELLARLLQDQQ